ncbi:MAG: hypothetical protein RIA65_03655, partial [Woeseia sp.]
MKFTSNLFISSVFVFAFSATAQSQEADLVLRNGVIWTVDEALPKGEAIATLRDKIIYVGDEAG